MDTPSAQKSMQHIVEHNLPRYSDLPSFGVYVDQLVSFVNEAVSAYAMPEEKLLTASMVNNYVKLGIIPKPDKKRYSQNHIAYLVAVCVLKKVLSIQEIAKLIQMQVDNFPIEQAFDSFIALLEQSIAKVFSGESTAQEKKSDLSDNAERLVEKAAFAFSNKLFIQITFYEYTATSQVTKKQKNSKQKQKGSKEEEQL